MKTDRSPIARGVLLALTAAALFGATTPFVQRASVAVGPIAAAALIYLGAGVTAFVIMGLRGRSPEGALPPRAFGRLVAVALIGGALAPSLLVLGLKHTDAATASLLLALEGPFTLLLARLFLRERLSGRVVAAVAAIGLGSLTLSLGPGGSRTTLIGPALIAAATLSWACENLISRGLADSDPLRVVCGKGMLGSAVAALVAWAVGEINAPVGPALALVAIGGVGYGLSLALYLGAQRVIGAGRTASVFAAAPFFGAMIALALGNPWPGPRLVAAAVLIAAGLWLHVTERHAHPHTHEPLEHEHLHRHDDGHHLHPHDTMPAGAHSHLHRHDRLEHEHEHGEDLHHRHPH